MTTRAKGSLRTSVPMTEGTTDVATRLAEVIERIAAAAARSGRPADAVTLVAVTKTVPVERIASAVNAGVTDLGENRVQEMLQKVDAIDGARWHFIGTLQRNKVQQVVGRVALIHSIDRLELAESVGRAAGGMGVTADVLVEVNATGEQTKHGVDLLDIEASVGHIAAVDGVRVRGLMTMGAAGDASRTRGAFRAVREAADRLGLPVVSMGMSGDYEMAIEEGATMVRLGTAVFGPRPPMRR